MMGCSTSKVLPSPKNMDNLPNNKNHKKKKGKSYVSVVQSLVGFTKERDYLKGPKNNNSGWFSAKSEIGISPRRTPMMDEKTRDERGDTYKDKFDARVTARYHIKALIGRGSFSRVVRAEHRTSRHPFAIKLMEVETPQAREVCATELAVLRRVHHPNVVRLVEVFQGARRVYVVLELATGGELLERVVCRGHYTERDATRALHMVLAGVGYLHSLGITHRDLKPENLLYYHPGVDSRLLLTDFGLATFGGTLVSGINQSARSGTSSTWSLRTTCGTPEYMAPEVVLRRRYSCAVDMWAVGVIAYILLSGSMPFEDDTRTRLFRSIVRGKYSFRGNPWPSVSDAAKDFVRALLESDPDRRLSAEQASRHSWILTAAAGSSARNLQRSISRNLRQRDSRNSSRCKDRATNSAAEEVRSVSKRTARAMDW
ncbi:serine/threonine-protein kinase H1-like [Syngnathoides biaculeatus]|uniref:serine/threonine-protein kinase H1-like n=1 Tax=Syngnathoides biaculeatus TaxID=300417 RepID=UPI002ADD3FBF|nr:serine/threonine-protein kinase H1-like [Syngnathoides biaculeatus]XP_061660758.1 serine/threonine-protein kinase H1-like [Syngnathoides biaculeatus]